MSETRAAVTRAEAAEMYGVNVRVIGEAIHSGALVAKRVGSGRTFRIAVSDLRAWFESLPDA